jgi:hypothetical protein
MPGDEAATSSGAVIIDDVATLPRTARRERAGGLERRVVAVAIIESRSLAQAMPQCAERAPSHPSGNFLMTAISGKLFSGRKSGPMIIVKFLQVPE